MRRFTVYILACLLLISLTLCGCSKQNTDYVINKNDTIYIGVLTQTSDDTNETKDILSGVSYASQLAHTVNLDKPYEVSVKTLSFNTEENIRDVATQLISENVAAVICEGGDKSTTDAIIKAFKEYKNTPLLFVDNYSNSIAEATNAYSISVPYSYQASAVVSHLIGEGKTTGAVVCSTDDDFNKDFAKMFTNTFSASGGSAVTTYYYSGDNKNFDTSAIASADYEFIFVIGNTDDNKQIHSELISSGVASSVVFSELTDKNAIETSEFNGVTFISKFEKDDNNYIGTDFINTYAKANNISTSDVTAGIAYGYDAYMTVYDSLVSINSNNNSIFQTTEADKNKAESETDIYVSDIKEAVNNITHMGVTDVVKFNDQGLATPSFIYTVNVENAHARMLSRYNYSNEQN